MGVRVRPEALRVRLREVGDHSIPGSRASLVFFCGPLGGRGPAAFVDEGILVSCSADADPGGDGGSIGHSWSVHSRAASIQISGPWTRLPIMPQILGQLGQVWDVDNIMLWAACCMCFYGFLRSGVPSAKDYDPEQHLSHGDVALDCVEAPSAVRGLQDGPIPERHSSISGTDGQCVVPSGGSGGLSRGSR